MKKEILLIKDLSFGYDKDKEIFSKINLEIFEGQILGILGPSGIGKSSLLRLITGLERPKSGEISFKGEVLSGNNIFVPAHKRGIGLVLQEKVLFPHLNSLDNVKFGIKGTNKEKEDQALYFLRLLKADKFSNIFPNSLSGGEQQRVAIARALAPKPDLVLLDEPFSSLDQNLREELRADTKELFKKTSTSCIIVTHELEEAKLFCDKIVQLKEGNFIEI